MEDAVVYLCNYECVYIWLCIIHIKRYEQTQSYLVFLWFVLSSWVCSAYLSICSFYIFPFYSIVHEVYMHRSFIYDLFLIDSSIYNLAVIYLIVHYYYPSSTYAHVLSTLAHPCRDESFIHACTYSAINIGRLSFISTDMHLFKHSDSHSFIHICVHIYVYILSHT